MRVVGVCVGGGSFLDDLNSQSDFFAQEFLKCAGDGFVQGALDGFFGEGVGRGEEGKPVGVLDGFDEFEPGALLGGKAGASGVGVGGRGFKFVEDLSPNVVEVLGCLLYTSPSPRD